MRENAQVSKGFITEFGFDLYIGNNFIAGHNLKMIDCNVVTIGNNITVGEEVEIYTSNHAFDVSKRAQHWCSESPVTIGNNVVIGNDVTILPGVTIGNNSWIKTSSVVVEDIFLQMSLRLGYLVK